MSNDLRRRHQAGAAHHRPEGGARSARREPETRRCGREGLPTEEAAWLETPEPWETSDWVRPAAERMAAALESGVRQDAAYLVPLRLFVGLGWLRACAEKVADPGWWDGSTLAAFLRERMTAGDVRFPPYAWLIEHAFLPHATALSLVVLFGQLLAGLGIAGGALTNAALLGGLFMNLNFLLAGAPNPSTFYIVIQVVLLLANVGAVLGIDARLAATIRSPLLAAARRCSPPSLLVRGHRAWVADRRWRRRRRRCWWPPTPCSTSPTGAPAAASRIRR